MRKKNFALFTGTKITDYKRKVQTDNLLSAQQFSPILHQDACHFHNTVTHPFHHAQQLMTTRPVDPSTNLSQTEPMHSTQEFAAPPPNLLWCSFQLYFFRIAKYAKQILTQLKIDTFQLVLPLWQLHWPRSVEDFHWQNRNYKCINKFSLQYMINIKQFMINFHLTSSQFSSFTSYGLPYWIKYND